MKEGLYVLGLTGSIGMGKSTTADMFRNAGIAVWDADAAVHELYSSHNETVEKISKIAPAAAGPSGIDRQILRDLLQKDGALFSKLEKIVHPAIRLHREAFLSQCRTLGLRLAVVDIPLLYETGAQDKVDGVLVVTIDQATQYKRVLARKYMTKETLELILEKQLPDKEKKDLADFIIETKTMDHVRSEVHKLIERLTGSPANA